MQAHLFGEPELQPSLSQWHTPAWLARRMAGWVPRWARVLEPSCGGGALIEGLIRAGHQPSLILAIDLDPAWARHCEERFPGLLVLRGDFRASAPELRAAELDFVLMNPPFEDNGHLRFVLRALELAPVVVGAFPVSFQFSLQRDRELWAPRAVVTRRAILPERVDYGGDQSPSFDSVVLQIERRRKPRFPGEVREVEEEVWTPHDVRV